MNAKKCSVKGCNSSSTREQDKGVTFHRLPKNIVLRNKWSHQARLDDVEKANKWTCICSRHFRKIDFEPYKSSKFALKLDAVPTIFPWGITSLEDLSKIFPTFEDTRDKQSDRLSSDMEMNNENKNVIEKDSQSSEEEIKSESEYSCTEKPLAEDDNSKEANKVDEKVEQGMATELPSESFESNTPVTKDTTTDVQNTLESENLEKFPIEKETEADNSITVETPIKDNPVDISEVTPIPVKKKRGRKPKVKTPIAEGANEQPLVEKSYEEAKRRSTRGRSATVFYEDIKENKLNESSKQVAEIELVNNEPTEKQTESPVSESITAPVPKKRGRKRKKPISPVPMYEQTSEEKDKTLDTPKSQVLESTLTHSKKLDNILKSYLSTDSPSTSSEADQIQKTDATTSSPNPREGKEWNYSVSSPVSRDFALDDRKIDKASSSPMLKALIEKSSPMMKPKAKLVGSFSSCYSDNRNFDSCKFSPTTGADKNMMIPGARVEAKDFSEQWYAARIIEVDHYEMEVLIHYDNWSQRYDEWISMSSPRLRMLNAPPVILASPAPPTYAHGERCLARWSDNRRFPATVINVLPEGKYEVRFDDGFIRILKWQYLSKAQTSEIQSTATTSVSPVPYGTRKSAPPLPAAPTSPLPPPIHNHLFDPSRDHLGSKEERRDMKRKLNVKELFSGQKRRRGKAGEKGTSVVGRRFKKFKTKIEKKLELEVKPKEEKVEPVEEIEIKVETKVEATEEKTDSVEDRPETPVMQKIITKTPVGTKKSSLGGIPRKKHSQTPSQSPKPSSPLTLKGIPETSIPSPVETFQCPSQIPDGFLKDEWSCKWVDSQPVGEVTILPPLERGRGVDAEKMQEGEGTEKRLERITVKVDDYRLPPGWQKFLTRRSVGNSAGKWDVVLVCPMGRRYRSRAEMRARLAEADGLSLEPYSHCLHDFSVHRKLARRLGWDTTTISGAPASAIGSPSIASYRALSPLPRVPSPLTQNRSEKRPLTPKIEPKPSPIHKPEEPLKKAVETTPLPIEPTVSLAPPEQPPLEDGFIYVGSLKVQIIDTLLRCPKEGCYKNFRKDNLLQMHIKHYHSELCSFLGDTPNVADLAYARTIVENVTPVKPVEKAHKVKEKKQTPSSTVPKIELDTSFIKSEPLEENINEPTTPVRNQPGDLEVLEHSPKLRNLLLEPKYDCKETSSKAKNDDVQDVEDILTSFKIKQEVDKPEPELSKKLKTDGSFKSKTKSIKIKQEKDLTKSQVKALISKVAEETNRSRSQSPSFQKTSETKMKLEGDACNENNNKPKRSMSSDFNMFPAPHKTKKKAKRRHFERESDFMPNKKKRTLGYMDIWGAFTPDPDETRSSFGTPEMYGTAVIGSPTPYLAENVIPKLETPIKESGEDNPSTIVTESGEKIKIVHMKREEIINCFCGYGEEDGLMIQCELCLCWQHAICYDIEKESQVPEKYVCKICQHPMRGRRSQRHLNNQDWLYDGRLPRASSSVVTGGNNIGVVLNNMEADQRRAATLKRSHQLSGNLLHVTQLLHSLRCKIEVSQKKDHPKLYLWSKPWDDDNSIADDNINNNTANKLNPEPQMNNGEHSQDGLSQVDLTNIQENFGIDIDEVKLESIEVSQVDDMGEQMDDDIPKCDNEIELTTSETQGPGSQPDSIDGDRNKAENMLANLLSSPGGTPIHLPITTSELETLAKSVQASAPQPEAAIDPAECRTRLLQHVERLQMLLDARLDSIEAQIAELESQDPSLEDDETPESYPRTKQTIQMLLRDLSTLEELGMVC